MPWLICISISVIAVGMYALLVRSLAMLDCSEKVKHYLQCIRLCLYISGTMTRKFLTFTVISGLPRRYILSLMYLWLSLMRICIYGADRGCC